MNQWFGVDEMVFHYNNIKRYEEVGVRHMMFPVVVRRPGVTLQQSLERMERFATKVMPLV